MQRRFLPLFIFLFSFSLLHANDDIDTLLRHKTETAQQGASLKEGWYQDRLITIGTHYYVKQGDAFVEHKDTADPVKLHLYKRNAKSQALIKSSSKSLGTSVDTSIHTKTKRNKEKKATHIQYDKTKIRQQNKDFQVDANRVNSKNVVQNKSNYDGGHLVDHKFSADGSHTDNANYVPQHHFYNSWMKEYIVKSADGYLEIPLYTKNPPLIKVAGENRYDPIPVGILLVPLKDQKVLEMYYFPNNQYNYRTCQQNLKIKRAIAKSMIENFKLKKELQKLLWPALIFDARLSNENLVKQQAQEVLREGVVDELIEGLSCTEYDDEDEIIPALASDVIHQPETRMALLYDVSEDVLKNMKKGQSNPDALGQACNALGEFLVEYALKNALKSELISTNSRIMFANIITDFIECYHQVTPEAMEQVDATFAEIYDDMLSELWRMKAHMSLKDIIFFANVYRKLSSPFIHDCLMNSYNMVEDMELYENFKTFIEILECVYQKAKSEEMDTPQKQNVVELFLEAQNNLAYLCCLGYPDEVYADERRFLRGARKRVMKWDIDSEATRGTYITSPNSVMSFVKMKGINETALSHLGTHSSMTYQN